MRGRRNGLICITSTLNEHAGGILQADETVKDISPNGPKNVDDLALKQNMYR